MLLQNINQLQSTSYNQPCAIKTNRTSVYKWEEIYRFVVARSSVSLLERLCVSLIIIQVFYYFAVCLNLSVQKNHFILKVQPRTS